MSKGDVINFMQTYQRITEYMFKKMPRVCVYYFEFKQ